MDFRTKVYNRNTSSEHVKKIRESVKANTKKRSFQISETKKERIRDKDEVQNHIENSTNAENGDYETKCVYLNKLKNLIDETKLEFISENSFFEDVCQLALKFLKNDHPCIRAMCFHILRKCTFNERNLTVMLTTHVDIYIVRAVDLRLENEQERIEAFKLINWMMKIYEKSNLKKLIDSSAEQQEGRNYAFPKSIMQPIISIALEMFQTEKNVSTLTENIKEKERNSDRMSMPCVGLFLEFCLAEPDLILDMAGTDWMVRVLTGISTMSRRIVVLVSHILISWLDNPNIRTKANLQLVLQQIFAPLVEYGLFQKRATLMINSAASESFHMTDVLKNFKFAFLALLRSWSGLFACASVEPNSNITSSSPLKLLEYLGLGTVENDNLIRIREAIVELCCEFLHLPYANKSFETWTDALQFYKTMHLPDKYKSSLKNDFVIAQNENKMKNDVNLEKPQVDLLAAFRCLSQFVLINASLPQSLARLILAHPDSSSGLKATLLMADMLRFVPSHIPIGWRAPVLSMPTLVQSACETLVQSKSAAAINGTYDSNTIEQYTFVHATNAELILHRFDQLNQTWIRSASQSHSYLKESDLYIFVPNMSSSLPLSVTPANHRKSKSDISLSQLSTIKPASPNTFEKKTKGTFNETVLKGKYNKEELLQIDDYDDYDYTQNNMNRDIVERYGDSSNTFKDSKNTIDWISIQYFVESLESELLDQVIKEFSTSSIKDNVSSLFSFILSTEQETQRRFLEKQQVIVVKSVIKLLLRIMPFNDSLRHDYSSIITKYVTNFRKSLESKKDRNSLFGTRNLSYTGTMYHFAIIGTLTMTQIGIGILNDIGILHLYVDIMTISLPTEYVKLIVSSLDYSKAGMTRIILGKALIATNEDSRKWCTRYLGVLASVDLPNFVEWGIQLILRQLADDSAKVIKYAIRLLTRWLPEYPSKSIQKIQFDLYGDAGEFLKAHYYSSESDCVNNEEDVKQSIHFWMKTFNRKYLDCVDEDTREMVFNIKRSMDGGFSRTSSDEPDTSVGVPAPLHLFAALGSHKTGRVLLEEENVCGELLANLNSSTGSIAHSNEIKSCLLALASIGSTNEGIEMLSVDIIAKIIKYAEEHSVLSVRGVAFWALVLISQCSEGAKKIAAFGWESNRYRYATDLAKEKASDNSTSKEDYLPSNFSWRTTTVNRKLTRQHQTFETQSYVEKQSRAKSESSIIRRGIIKGIRRSSSESRILVQPILPAETNNAIKSSSRMWKSEICFYKNSETSTDETPGTPFFKRSVTPISFTQHFDEFQDSTINVIDNWSHFDDFTKRNDGFPSSCATSKLSEERKRANTTNSLFDEKDFTKSRLSTVARCIRDGLKISRDQLELEAIIASTTTDPHFSCRLREKYDLKPFRVRTTLQIHRNIGDPVRYVFMTKDEERNFANYVQNAVGDSWLYNELKKEDKAVKKTVNVVPLQTVALPAEIELICMNVFTSNKRIDSIFGVDVQNGNENSVDSRGARTGHTRSDILIQPHSAYRCFYCSGKEENMRSTYPHPDAVSLRKEVLNQVDMLEIKEYPAKRLIGLRQHHHWLFKWPCLYADVLELLDEYRFKPHTRSFLQQIFYDAFQL